MNDRMLTVREVTERFGVSDHTVLRWIRSGELSAIDVSRRPGGRPRWRIAIEALAKFEKARTPRPPSPKKPRKRQAKAVQFY